MAEILNEQERELEKSTAEAYGLLSMAFFRTALLALGREQVSLIATGVAFALFSIYLAFIHKWRRKRVLEIASKIKIRHVAWFLAFILLGTALIQKEGNLVIPGIICFGIAYVILGAGIGESLGRLIRGIITKVKAES